MKYELPDVLDCNIIHLNRYIKFIETRINRVLLNEDKINYHHILPRSMGGKDTNDNIVALSIREHFIAHIMLWKCGYSEMSQALWIMTNGRFGNLSSKQYERLYMDFLKKISLINSGKNHPMYGRHHTNETKDKISKKTKGKEKHKNFSIICQERMSRLGNPMAGRHHSEETKLKIGLAGIGRKMPIKTPEQLLRMSNAQKGKKLSKEHILILSIVNSKPKSKETKLKISEANKGKHAFGHPHTDEFKKRMRLNNPSALKILCIEDDIVYSSVEEASTLLNISYYMIKKSINNNVSVFGKTFKRIIDENQ